MKPTPYLIMLVAASVTGSWLFAAEPTPTQQQAAKAAQPAAPEKKASAAGEAKKAPAAGEEKKDAAATDAATDKSAAATEKDAADKDKKGTEKTEADKKSSPQRFIPSEQVRADFDVSFPVDI
ncbi:MAG TPA: hypothetical protein VKB34_00820 [Povalibacter sp.]|nr:hypothetical protein [Povalibacter sp.]